MLFKTSDKQKWEDIVSGLMVQGYGDLAYREDEGNYYLEDDTRFAEMNARLENGRYDRLRTDFMRMTKGLTLSDWNDLDAILSYRVTNTMLELEDETCGFVTPDNLGELFVSNFAVPALRTMKMHNIVSGIRHNTIGTMSTMSLNSDERYKKLVDFSEMAEMCGQMQLTANMPRYKERLAGYNRNLL